MPINWDPLAAIHDFGTVASLAGIGLPDGAIEIETLSAPHLRPPKLPTGKVAVYVLSYGPTVLKVGRVGAKSGARYTSQHHNPKSSNSNLAKSILADCDGLNVFNQSHFDDTSVGEFIRDKIDRVNLLMNEQLGIPVLILLEAFLQCRLQPRYEGFKSQRR